MMPLTRKAVFTQADESECALTWTLEHEDHGEQPAQLRVDTDGGWVGFTHREDVALLIAFLEDCAAALPCNDPTDDPSVALPKE